MHIAGRGLHGKVVAYALAEKDIVSHLAVSRLLEVLQQGHSALDESDFWLLVEMLGRKLVALHERGEIAPELVHSTGHKVLVCTVMRWKARGATGMGRRKTVLFLQDLSRVRYAADIPIYDHFFEQYETVPEGDPLKLLPDDVQAAISEHVGTIASGTSREKAAPRKTFRLWSRT